MTQVLSTEVPFRLANARFAFCHLPCAYITKVGGRTPSTLQALEFESRNLTKHLCGTYKSIVQ